MKILKRALGVLLIILFIPVVGGIKELCNGGNGSGFISGVVYGFKIAGDIAIGLGAVGLVFCFMRLLFYLFK